jgi:hypothetical protein
VPISRNTVSASVRNRQLKTIRKCPFCPPVLIPKFCKRGVSDADRIIDVKEANE